MPSSTLATEPLPISAFEPLTLGAWADIMALRQRVLAQLPLADLYVREADEAAFVHAHLGAHGTTLGLRLGGQLVAYAMLGWPAADDALVRCLPAWARPADGGQACAILASCMVVPEHRGRGLQRQLVQARIALAQAQGRGRCIAMVSPHNHASRHNLMQAGLGLVWAGQLAGLQRHVLALATPPGWPNDAGLAAAPARCLPALDIAAQQALLAQGMIGTLPPANTSQEAIFFRAHHCSSCVSSGAAAL